jgi:hypothetical protein
MKWNEMSNFHFQCPTVKISPSTAKTWRQWTCAECIDISISVACLVERRARSYRLHTTAIQEGVQCYQWAFLLGTYIHILVMQSILTYYICLPLLWSLAVKTELEIKLSPFLLEPALEYHSDLSFHFAMVVSKTLGYRSVSLIK